GDNTRSRLQLRLALADFERRVGRLAEARRALEPARAPGVPAALRRRALDIWPEPPLAPEAEAAVAGAAGLVTEGKPAAALEALAKVPPAATAVRFVRARALEALGRYDEATSELSILLQVRPSHARAWRLLGTILAQHGGTLEAERADQALRRALALEPSWDDLRALRAVVAEKRRRAVGPGRAGGGGAAAAPSRKA